jgi:hypothetical protein
VPRLLSIALSFSPRLVVHGPRLSVIARRRATRNTHSLARSLDHSYPSLPFPFHPSPTQALLSTLCSSLRCSASLSFHKSHMICGHSHASGAHLTTILAELRRLMRRREIRAVLKSD